MYAIPLVEYQVLVIFDRSQCPLEFAPGETEGPYQCRMARSPCDHDLGASTRANDVHVGWRVVAGVDHHPEATQSNNRCHGTIPERLGFLWASHTGL